jgi:Flp pilus assembly protein TadG
MGTRPVPHGSGRDESGAVFVEFVAVLPFFLFLIFAMVSYGSMFSFRQTLSQAATEGARAAAVAPSNLDFASRRTRAITAVNEAFQGEPGSALSCGSGGLTCTIPTTPTTCASTAYCISVTLTYAYAAHPRLPVPQFFSFALPSALTYAASARVQ